jgi:aminopeptidase
MNKKLIKKIAKKIIIENLSLKEKETILIHAGPKSLEFAEHLAYESSIIGAHPIITYGSSLLAYRIYKDIDKKFLKHVPKISKYIAENVEAEIIIDEQDPFLEKRLPQEKLEIRRKSYKPIRRIKDKRIIDKKVKIALLGFPTKETAKAIGISFNKLSKIFWSCLDTDYNKIYEYNKNLIKLLEKANKIKIYGKETELELSIKGRILHNACGLWEKEKMGYLNLPDGEVFCAPIETSANGEIYFDLPCLWHYGKQVQGVWFKFKNGRVVDYNIEKGEKEFENIMKNSSGKKDYIAELGIGTNPRAKITGGMTIIDEKVRGTIHIAIGSNKSFGGKNEATIHWDFFKEMRNKSEIYADNRLIMKNGKVIF